MKKVISLLICIAFLMMPCVQTFAQDDEIYSQAEYAAEDLKALGLFKGVSENDFALSRAPTRAEALVMLIRLLGEEQKALLEELSHPFSDAPEWADKYIAYGYEKGYTNGISETEFGSDAFATKEMYLTFVLRALGYNDGDGEGFRWDSPYKLSEEAGILKHPDVSAGQFLRADVVLISHCALNSTIKGDGEGKTLAEKLIADGAFDKETYNDVFRTDEEPESEKETEKARKFDFIKGEGELFVDDIDLFTGTKAERATRLLKRFIETKAYYFTGVYEYLVYHTERDTGDDHYMLMRDRETDEIHVVFEHFPVEGGLYFVRMVLKDDGETLVSVAYYTSRRAENPQRQASAYFEREDICYGMNIDFENFEGRFDEESDFEEKAQELIPEAVEFLDDVMKKNFAFYGYGSAEALGFDI